PMGSVNIDLNIGGTITSLPISYPATDSLMPGAKDTITIDTAASWAIGNLIIVTTSLPNGVVDPDPSDDNDTVSVAALGLSGTFTLDPTGSGPTNFVSFNDAVNNLIQFGVCGPVTINVATGVYQEQIDIPEILGMSMTNTVTFQSATLDSSDVTMNYTPIGGADNFTVRLNGSSHFRFRHLTLSSDGSFNNRVVEFSGSSDDNWFMNNHIFNTVNTNSTSNFRAVIYSNIGSINNNIRIENNLIENGSYGIWLQGGGIGTEETGNIINNNEFIDFYFNGIYAQYQDALTFEHNFMETMSPYTFTGYGARFLNTTGGMDIMNNTVSQDGTATGQPLWGMQCSSCFGNNLDRITVANNSIHVGEPNVTNVVSGIEWTTSGPADIYNNSVNAEGNNFQTRALRAQNGGGNLIFNNVLANTGQQGVSVWYSDPFAVSQSNFNDLWSVTGDLAAFGGGFTLPAPETTLAGWQATTAFDLNSISVDPQFAGPNDLHTCADELDQAATAMFGLGLDFDGEPRDQVAPDIGADEFLGLANFAAGSDTIVCAQELVLNVTGAQSVLWSTGETNPIITVTTPQNPLIVSVVTSCGAASDTFAVSFAPLPNLVSDVHLCADEQIVLDPGVPNSMYSWSTGSTGQSIVVTSDDPGTYIVDINDTASGCITSDTTVITASEGVDLGDDQTLCTPNTLTLDASISGGAVYVWSTNEFTSSITVSQSGTYSVSVTDSSSCISVDEVVVQVAEAPDASFFTTVNFLTGIFTNTSTLFGNNTYLWDFGDGNSSTDENPTHVYAFPAGGSGDFVVTLTVSNECGSSTFTDTVSIGVTVGIEDLLAGESGIAVFPNPNNGDFRVALQTNGTQTVNVDVLDLQGRVIFNLPLGSVNGRVFEEITLDNVAKGVYMVKVTMDDQVRVERLSIQ
ncbi:MAG: PKD domain-containing protein, partial [Bacteroidota bacterium]